jgi:hypothetical protein
MKKTLLLLLVVVLLAACTPSQPVEPTPTPVDVSAIQTSVVQTVVAGVTETIEALPPTPTDTPLPPTATLSPTPEFTLTPTVNICDDSDFVADISVPDNTVMAPGQEFVKTWKVKNTGSCNWTRGYTIVPAYGEKMSGVATALSAEVLSNQEVEISVILKAPQTPGTYSGYWRLQNNNGYAFGEYLTIVIIVQ